MEPREQVRLGQRFAVGERIVKSRPYGSGHINDTYLLTGENGTQFILQRMNREVFASPKELMENICGVTEFLRGKIREANGDPDRETLTVIPVLDREKFFTDEKGDSWRMYLFVTDTVSLDQPRNNRDLAESGRAFGRFFGMLADYPAETLHETIPFFHHTKKRYEALMEAAKKDVCHRRSEVERELSFFEERREEMGLICDLLDAGGLPLRVTHNDTKLNNVLMDKKTGKGLCVIDLDTVMPGSPLYDFGDAIRFGANTAAEDEPELGKVSLDLDRYRAFTEGFLLGCGGKLTPAEKELLPMGAKLMTMECGMRFLADDLAGDTYFKIHRQRQNLDRARVQIELVKDMERKWDEMKNNDIVFPDSML